MTSPFPLWFEIIAAIGATLCFVLALWCVSWHWLRSSENQHRLLGATVIVLLLWAVRAGISPGLALHFLGVTSLTLIFGWPLALFSLLIAAVGSVLAGDEAWSGLGVIYLINAVVPVAVSWNLYQWVHRRLPKHLFIYLFVAVFAAAALSIITVILLNSLIMISLGIYTLDQLAYEYLSFIPLLALPEAVLNGFIMTGLVIYKPSWVATYDEKLYLKR